MAALSGRGRLRALIADHCQRLNSIKSNLLKTCLKRGFRPRIKVCKQVRGLFWSAAVCDLLDLIRHVGIHPAGLRAGQTFYRRKQGLSKIEAMEFENDKRTDFFLSSQ